MKQPSVVGLVEERHLRSSTPEFISETLMYGLKPVPFKLTPVPFKLTLIPFRLTHYTALERLVHAGHQRRFRRLSITGEARRVTGLA
jgi:hypothetical protein